MSSLKIPIIVGITGFLLIFIINLIIGNALFIIISRSLIYGLLVSGIIFGITFVFKNYLGIDLEFNETDSENGKPNIDVVVGEEEERKSEDELVYSENEENDNSEEEIDKTISLDGIQYESNELNLDEDRDIEDLKNENNNERVDEVSKNESIFTDDEKDDSNYENIEEKNETEDIDNLGYLSYDDEKIEDEKEIDDNKPELTSDSIKDKIGIDVSFEDVAKAIRTKLKSDD